jgi:hypothetical protein
MTKIDGVDLDLSNKETFNRWMDYTFVCGIGMSLAAARIITYETFFIIRKATLIQIAENVRDTKE